MRLTLAGWTQKWSESGVTRPSPTVISTQDSHAQARLCSVSHSFMFGGILLRAAALDLCPVLARIAVSSSALEVASAVRCCKLMVFFH
jgi:hypothetical protein